MYGIAFPIHHLSILNELAERSHSTQKSFESSSIENGVKPPTITVVAPKLSAQHSWQQHKNDQEPARICLYYIDACWIMVRGRRIKYDWVASTERRRTCEKWKIGYWNKPAAVQKARAYSHIHLRFVYIRWFVFISFRIFWQWGRIRAGRMIALHAIAAMLLNEQFTHTYLFSSPKTN